MSLARRGGAAAAASCLVASAVIFGLAASCQTVAGIEERTLGPCGEYCDAVMLACQGNHAVYATFDMCMGVCELLPPGDSLEPRGENSVACRLAEARLAASSEPDVHCPLAGPAGGGDCGGGGGCESYCVLYQAACGDAWFIYGTLEECTESCGALRDTGGFDVVGDYGGDTLQCRLVHTSSATVDPDEHCGHAQLAPPTAPCVDLATDAPECARYCDVIGHACEGANAQYESRDQCLASCAALVPGTNADTATNTVGCRLYHAYNALLDAATHCSHAGPTGDGHCGSVDAEEQALCDSYCRLIEDGCPSGFADGMTAAACVTGCSALQDAAEDSHYSVPKGIAGGGTLACRTLHAVRALAGDADACVGALGGTPCL